MAEYRRSSAELLGTSRIAFGEYQFDRRAGQLWRGAEEIKLAPRASALLAALSERSMQVVTKKELIERLWDGRAVGDDALTSCVLELRRALGDDPRNPRFVETRYRRGYRLLVPVIPAAIADWATEKASPLALPNQASIAVLPFENLNGDAEQEYFADSVAEDILTALSRFPNLFVVSRKSSFTYKGKAADIKQIGRDLGARYVLEGSVRKAGGQVRVTGQLIQADTGTHIWADRYDGDLDDVLAFPDRITEAIAGVVAPSVQQAEIARAQRKPPSSLDAYDLHLRALGLLNVRTRGREAHNEARQLVERAMTLDPDYAAPMALFSAMLDWGMSQGWYKPSEVAADSKKYRQLAAQIDRNNANIVANDARGMAFVEGRHEEAIGLIERALALNPNSAVACQIGGLIHVHAGQPEPAFVLLHRPCDSIHEILGISIPGAASRTP